MSELSVQLYTVREGLEQDFDGTLARIAGFGFTHVEPFALPEFADDASDWETGPPDNTLPHCVGTRTNLGWQRSRNPGFLTVRRPARWGTELTSARCSRAPCGGDDRSGLRSGSATTTTTSSSSPRSVVSMRWRCCRSARV